MSSPGFNYFGWEGVSFLKPADWDLSHVEGKAEKGYAVLDDGLKSRVQLRWQKAGREADLEKIAARQKKVFSKKGGAAGTEPEITDFKIRTFKGKKFSFKIAGVETRYYMLQCRDCLQVLLLGIFGERGEDFEEICGRVMESLSDHARDGMIIWSVFGFTFSAPVGLTLKGHRLHSGDIGFEFWEGKDSVFFNRVSLAALLLKKKSFNRWVVDFMAGKHPKVSVDNVFENSEFRAKGVSVIGREMSGLKLFKKRFFNGYFWVSEEKNAIFGAAELRAAPGSRMKELLSGVGFY